MTLRQIDTDASVCHMWKFHIDKRPQRSHINTHAAWEAVCDPCHRLSIRFTASIMGNLTQTKTDMAESGAYFGPTEHWFIIIHVGSVIRPGGGPWLVDSELPSAYCSSLPAEPLSFIPTRSHPASYSCGRSVITAAWTLSVGTGCVCVKERVLPKLWCVIPPTPVLHQQRENTTWGANSSSSDLI